MTHLLKLSDWLPSLARTASGLVVLLGCPAFALAIAVYRPCWRTLLAQDSRLLLQGLHRDTYWPLALVVLMSVGALVMIHPFPPDDLARDLVAYTHHFDYRLMFWGSPGLPPYNQYIGFDYMAAVLRGISPTWRALPFQLLPLIGLLSVLSVALGRIFADIPHRRLWVAAMVLLTLLMPGVATRIVQGRPELWFSVWALTALVLPRWIWFGIGVLMTPLYWLAPVYAVGGFLLRTDDDWFPWHVRLKWVATTAGTSALMWLAISCGQWADGFNALSVAVHNRIGTVSETETVWTLMAGSTAAVWAVVAWHYRRGFRIADDQDLLLVLGVFLLPDMVRYTSVVSPLLVLLLARSAARDIAAENRDATTPATVKTTVAVPEQHPALLPAAGVRLLLTWACLFLLPLGFAGPAAPAPGFLAHVRPGDRVLSPFSPTLYRSIFAAAPRGAVLAPAMEVGMTLQPVQQMALNLANGKVDCAGLERNHVRWVVEDAIAGTPPACLHLDSTDGALRAWRVDRPPNRATR